MAGINCEIRRHVAVLSMNEKTGWKREANIVSWNGGSEKLAIRDWSPDHVKMSKGITLNESESRELSQALTELFRR